MAERCHYCHEPITRHEDTTEVMDWDGPSRVYHDDCHRLDLLAHRDNPLPEMAAGPPLWPAVNDERRDEAP